MVKDHSDNEGENPLLPSYRLHFLISSKYSFICSLTDWLVTTSHFKTTKEGNVLFNDTQHILFTVRHTVKYHTDSERGNLLPPHGLLFPINSSYHRATSCSFFKTYN